MKFYKKRIAAKKNAATQKAARYKININTEGKNGGLNSPEQYHASMLNGKKAQVNKRPVIISKNLL